MIAIGDYAGKTETSGFVGPTFKTIAEAQLWLKNHLDWITKNSYGIAIWETNSHVVRPGLPPIPPKEYLVWHRDHTNCFGRLYNPETGWCFRVDHNDRIIEEFLEPETNDK